VEGGVTSALALTAAETSPSVVVLDDPSASLDPWDPQPARAKKRESRKDEAMDGLVIVRCMGSLLWKTPPMTAREMTFVPAASSEEGRRQGGADSKPPFQPIVSQ
jgi:hypothetical protein